MISVKRQVAGNGFGAIAARTSHLLNKTTADDDASHQTIDTEDLGHDSAQCVLHQAIGTNLGDRQSQPTC